MNRQMTNETMSSRMPSRTLRALLIVASGVLAAVGVPLLLDPIAFYDLSASSPIVRADLLSDLRSSGVLLVTFAGLAIYGGLSARMTRLAAGAVALVFIAYGVARLFAFAVDGLPSTALLAAAAIEWALGIALLTALTRTRAPA